MTTKYGNRRVVDPQWGIFDSVAERQRWLELVALDQAGEIVLDTDRQPTLVLSEKPKCVYTPDFMYWEGGEGQGRCVVEDVKGVSARDVFVRIAWTLQRFPNLRVRLLRRPGRRLVIPRGWRLVGGWLVREYSRTDPKRGRAA